MAEVNAYSWLDRALHRFAFASPGVQLAASDIGNKLFARELEAVTSPRPIFITSLPRAGTTVLLTALHTLPSLASHTYRDMPFVMAPLLWSRFSGAFQKEANLSERAHGDGVQIGYDSPEAFEEVIWRAFWPGKYRRNSIELWREDDFDAEARDFLDMHMRKIIALRRPEDPANGRYISKNNANVARLELIGRLFPDASIIVPVREPIAHAQSLLRQHRNFLDLHAHDSFARRYMGDIGHYEFGELHRPIAFPGFSGLAAGLSPDDLDYWLAYWIAAFEHVRGHRERVIAIGYEHLCRDAPGVLRQIADRCALDLDDDIDAVAAHFRAAPVRDRDVSCSAELRRRAEEVYDDIVQGREARSRPTLADAPA